MGEIFSEERIAGYVTSARKHHFLLPTDVEHIWASHEALRAKLTAAEKVIEIAQRILNFGAGSTEARLYMHLDKAMKEYKLQGGDQ